MALSFIECGQVERADSGDELKKIASRIADGRAELVRVRSRGGILTASPMAVGSGVKRPPHVEGDGEPQKRQKVKGFAFLQAKAMSRMAAAIMLKARILEDQNLMTLFTMPDDQLTTDDAREYFRLRRIGELARLKQRLGENEGGPDPNSANGGDYQLSSAEAAQQYSRLRKIEELVANLEQRLGESDLGPDPIDSNILGYHLTSAEAAREYFRLRRIEELAKFKQWLGRKEPGLRPVNANAVEHELLS